MSLRFLVCAAALLAACSDAATTAAPESNAATDAGGVNDSPSPSSPQSDAGGPHATCDQSLTDKLPPTTTSMIAPANPVVPFYQWEANNGYCGETSMIQAGLFFGQWISQYNARLLCGAQGNGKDAPRGTPLLQTGPDGFCSDNDDTPDFNAQLLLESSAAANAKTCLANYRLDAQQYDYANQSTGLAGYREYMAWVKAQTIAGHPVTVGVLVNGGEDPQYDHIVSVLGIGTNHSPTDAAYYDDDVLFFDDHGGTVFPEDAYPAVPPGAGSAGCTPYRFGYTFGELAKTRDDANAKSANAYSLLIPGVPHVPTNTGGDGISEGPPVTGHNYAFAAVGALATDATFPVRLTITETKTNGVANPPDPIAGLDYETPHIGTDDTGDACTNDPPTGFMDMTFGVTVSGLTAGTSYVLYEYDFDSVSGAALAVPMNAFNANASAATAKTPFVAAGDTFSTSVTRSSKETIVFRAVTASAP